MDNRYNALRRTAQDCAVGDVCWTSCRRGLSYRVPATGCAFCGEFRFAETDSGWRSCVETISIFKVRTIRNVYKSKMWDIEPSERSELTLAFMVNRAVRRTAECTGSCTRWYVDITFWNTNGVRMVTVRLPKRYELKRSWRARRVEKYVDAIVSGLLWRYDNIILPDNFPMVFKRLTFFGKLFFPFNF